MSVNPGDGTGAIEKAIDVLEAVGATPGGVSQSDLAAQLALPRTTVYRLLATLVARGMLRRDPLRKVYRLGFRCFEMARQAYTMPDLVAAAAHEMRGLRDLTGETCYLATLDGLEVISLERCDGAHSERSAAVLGQRKPVHCTSQGKAILSAMEGPARDAIVRDLTLKALTPLTITDRRRLNAELNITAARGYSIDDEEIVMGVRCVGAPIVDPEGVVRGAISVAGPAYRLTRARLELLGPEVAQAARRIGAQLEGVRAPAGDAAVTAVPGPWAFQGGHPLWCARRQRLYWADVLAPSVRMLDTTQDPARDEQLLRLEAPVTGMLLRGEEVWAMHDDGAVAIAADGSRRPLEGWPRAPLQAFCDGGDVGNGAQATQAVWAAMESAEGGSSVGLLRDNGSLEVRWHIGEAVQALCWSAADDTLYATTPASGAILMLQPGSAAVRRLASMPPGAGKLSGLALDTSGGIWTALCEGWSVVRFTRDGTLDRVVGMPVPCPSDVAIGGANLDTLYITTSRQQVSLETLAKAPQSGCLFEVKV
ncbi:IclR family transcriptional regulator C-terminal domain-containing protein [Cupriavidus sp. CV2]|uniref:IclR family transcriptional regulator domain-containing protein n=1 Tax=Cupriavidus ulmosensis TaxID=3065913 RepID=UPI00296B3F01|nr:IclR family transcriptional regulator C-terminal domain-containing protein [Cupriavidus sp. CV2]MDW3682023.1 IclR family transcriptional regulator C-terminal domain-containing protein [Cupriavidus sp. CV2]